MRHSIRFTVASLLLGGIAPGLADAQAAGPAGVVTALAGTVTVARAAAPQPLPLRFKDEVFLRDRISTAEGSLARVLLGGKALATIRELSVLTITEESGRSTVDVQRGLVGVSVARQRLQPGESVEIRTPNAVAAVRGTTVIVEVIGLAAAITCNFYVIQGSLDIALLGAAPGATVRLDTQRALTVTGGVLGQPRPLPPGIQARFGADLLKARTLQQADTALDARRELGLKQQAIAIEAAIFPGLTPGGKLPTTSITGRPTPPPPPLLIYKDRERHRLKKKLN